MEDVYRIPWKTVRGLGGGGVAPLRYDPQGKAHAQMLLDYPMQVPEQWVAGGWIAVSGIYGSTVKERS